MSTFVSIIGIVRATQSINQTYIHAYEYIEIVRLGENEREIKSITVIFHEQNHRDMLHMLWALCLVLLLLLLMLHACMCARAIKHKIYILRSLWLLSWTTGSGIHHSPHREKRKKAKTKRSKAKLKEKEETKQNKNEQMWNRANDRRQ